MIEAQQIVVSVLIRKWHGNRKLILCHSPGSIQSNGGCNLGTHDLLKELLTDGWDDFVAVFPNIHAVINSPSKHESKMVSFSRLCWPAMKTVIQ